MSHVQRKVFPSLFNIFLSFSFDNSSSSSQTWVQQTALESRFQRGEKLLSLVGSLQTKLQILDGCFRLWEI